MRQEASRLTNLVQDIITLSRIQAAEPVPILLRAGRWDRRRGAGPVPDEGERPGITLADAGDRGLGVLGTRICC